MVVFSMTIIYRLSLLWLCLRPMLPSTYLQQVVSIGGRLLAKTLVRLHSMVPKQGNSAVARFFFNPRIKGALRKGRHSPAMGVGMVVREVVCFSLRLASRLPFAMRLLAAILFLAAHPPPFTSQAWRRAPRGRGRVLPRPNPRTSLPKQPLHIFIADGPGPGNFVRAAMQSGSPCSQRGLSAALLS